jgi:Stress responsive A/B Barrel Domain
MIRHIVLVRFKPDADTSKIFAALKALQGTIDGIISITAGADNSPEGLQRGNTHGFAVDFRDANSRDAYLPHPEHQKVGSMIVAAAEGGTEGITVVDWEVLAAHYIPIYHPTPAPPQGLGRG